MGKVKEDKTSFLKAKLDESIANGTDSFLDDYKDQVGEYKVGDLLAPYIEKICPRKKDERRVREASQLTQSTYNHILSDDRRPSRNSMLCILIALGLDIDTCNRLLKKAGFNEIYIKNKRDVVIYKGISRKKSVMEINELLDDEGLEMLTKK